jgi:hypothetical protein
MSTAELTTEFSDIMSAGRTCKNFAANAVLATGLIGNRRVVDHTQDPVRLPTRLVIKEGCRQSQPNRDTLHDSFAKPIHGIHILL